MRNPRLPYITSNLWYVIYIQPDSEAGAIVDNATDTASTVMGTVVTGKDKKKPLNITKVIICKEKD